MRRASAEGDLRHLAHGRVVDLQRLGSDEAEAVGHERGGEDFALVVVGQHRIVISLPRERHAIFGGGQLLGELHHGLVGLQIGIGFLQREQMAQRLGQGILAAAQLLHRRRIAGIGLRIGQPADRRIARLHHRLERAALMREITLGGLDQIRYQVVPAGQLHVDLRKSVLVTVA